MKIAHIGDIHWGLNYPGPTPQSRFNDICTIMNWSADRIIEEGCELVLMAGDAFKDARVFIDRASIEIKAFADWLRRLTSAGIDVIVISGTPSHDAVAAYEIIKEMLILGVKIHTVPAVETFNNVSIVCLPGMNRSGILTEEECRGLAPHVVHQIMTDRITETCQSLRNLCGYEPRILMGHLTFDMAEKGFEDVLMQHEPVLTREATEGFDLVLLGHIHRPQRNENVFYCGSPERLSFNDEHITPGFWIHEVGGSSRFIETPARQFYTAQWNERDVERYLDGNNLSFVFDGAITRIHYTCSEELNRRLNRKALEKDLYDAGAFFVQEIKADIQRTDRARDQEVTESLGPVETVGKWAVNQNIAQSEIEALQRMTASLIEEVSA
ncbi:metallophosphoesterase family protein [Candidatus Formimonas warabiya]|uniref:Nuclease SbcCD subunit D n=1 Tax=Formimonas warabiya TaxID=1761012 RepID=A0A3G1KNU1_FORW1|nr:exonuclease subunit SbcD [Candidatus Formimonas warabiya]ATW24132.1 hypothetical protein DCMF_04460 [Candidatus Formimonas warabiya]